MNVENRLASKKRRSQKIAFEYLAQSYSVVALLFVILAFIVVKGIGAISWEFIE
jgi:phosphate transport system permease protein